MKYTLEIYDIKELGQRDNQEDALFPEYGQSTDKDRLFIVCDGMGGHSSGEVASNTVCEAMSKSILEDCPDPNGSFARENLFEAISKAFDELDKKDDGAFKKMGTTMTLLKLHSQGCTIAHIGDSRVYHIRPGKERTQTIIKHQTNDHSLVNALIKAGELKPDDPKISNIRNVITQAMQPGTKKHVRADIYETADILPGDYFMLCTDGILEEMEDDTIREIFSDEIPTAREKRDKIKELTKNNKDNHTAIIVHITDVIDPIENSPQEDTPLKEESKQPDEINEIEQNRASKKDKKFTILTLIAAFIILTTIIAALVYMYKNI